MFTRVRQFVKGAEGSIMVITAIGLVAFLGFASLAIDIGHLYVVRNELQNTADAAALAGVSYLIKDQGGETVRDATAAQQAAMSVAQRQSELLGLNPVDASARNDLTIVIGEWNTYTGNPETAWTEIGATCGPYANANAVRVTLRRAEGLAFGPATNFLAGVLGIPTSGVMATATAYMGYVKGAEVGSVTLPLALPETVLTAANRDGKSWWASLLGPKEAVASSTRQVTFKDLGSDTFYQDNISKPLFDTQKGYLFIVNSADPVPGTVVDNIRKTYTQPSKPVRAMERGTRLYPISEYQWASNNKVLFSTFKLAYNANKDGSARWKVLVPVYSTTNPLASRLEQGFLKVAKLFSLGPTPAQACFTFWNQSYPGGNVPIYVDGFANVNVVNVNYEPSCDQCIPYAPAKNGQSYLNAADCMVKNPDSCRNVNSITVEVPLDASTASPPGTFSGGPDNQHITPGGATNKGALAASPKLVK